MLHKALEQFLTDVFWDDPDFLLVDLPAGHRRHLHLAGPVPARAPRSTSSPRRSPPPRRWRSAPAFMAQKVNLEVKGVIENMSWFTGDDGKRYELFGAGGGDELAERARACPLLGQVPARPRAAGGRRLRSPDRAHRARRRGGPGLRRASPSRSRSSWPPPAATASRAQAPAERAVAASRPPSAWRRPRTLVIVDAGAPPRSRTRRRTGRSGAAPLLGMLGLGAAGVLWGAKVQTGMEAAAPARSRSRTAPASPACLPVHGPVPHLHRHRHAAEPQRRRVPPHRRRPRRPARRRSTSPTSASGCRRPR